MTSLQRPTINNILAEGLLWALLFIVVVELGIAKAFTAVLKSKGIYKHLRAQKGVMGPNLADDIVVMLGFGLQHFFAGALIIFGTYSGNLGYVRSGLLCEWGWESKDFVNVVTATGPYREGSVTETYRASLKFHHLPGIVLALPIVYYELHQNTHVQTIAAIMILFGGVGVLCNVVRLTAKHAFNANPRYMFVLGVVDTIFCFGFLRFAVFPYEVYRLVLDLVRAQQYVIGGLVVLGFLMMFRFNVSVFLLKLEKLLEFTRPASDSSPKLLKRASSSLHPVVGDVD